jgi:hypothetical protein
VEADWEVEVEFTEGGAVAKDEIEDAAGAKCVEDGEVMLANTFEGDCGVLIGEAVCEATDRNVVFVASAVVVPVVEEEYFSGSGLNRVSVRHRIAGRM